MYDKNYGFIFSTYLSYFAVGLNVSSPTELSGRLNGNLSDADDEILESLVKTATKTPVSRSTTPRERKRTRNADRKSCKSMARW